MNEFLDEQTRIFSSLVQEMSREPFMHVGVLQTFLKEELRGLEVRVRGKMQAMREETNQEFAGEAKLKKLKCDTKENACMIADSLLAAFCKECLEDKGLEHEDILNQQREYARIDKFFKENADKWTWKHVSQDGRCCLNGIWVNHSDRFQTFDSFVSACASAAVSEVETSIVLTNQLKREFTVKFKELLRAPQRLSVLWSQMEVQFLWLGLTNVVLPKVQIKVFELENRTQDVVDLKCIQSIPDEATTARREAVYCMLQWNRKVVAHFDLIEEKACAVAVAVAVSAAVAVSPHQAPPLVWDVGTLLEAEMMDENFPDYKDTLHPVQVVEVLHNGKEYRCRLLAFDDEDVWTADLLHKVRDSTGRKDYKNGDQVHIRIKNRRIGRKSNVDGIVSSKGIWVKGTVVDGESRDGFIVVEHVDWESLAKKKSRVGFENARSCF
jgi:hypothetical protein